MTLHEHEKGLLITHLSLEEMALLSLPLPLTEPVRKVLTALLEGRRVWITDDAFEYKRYRRTAPPGVYRRLVSMERQVRQLGLVRAPQGGKSCFSAL